MAQASRDQNNVPTLLGVSSADGTTPTTIYADPNSHRLLIDAAGGVTGPGSSTDNAIVRWDGVTGLVIQNSSVTIDDAKTGVGSSTLFTQTATKTVANSAAETSLDSTGVGSKTLPANFLIAGRTLRIIVAGIHSSTGNPTIRIKVKAGSTVLLDSTAVTSGNSTNSFFEARGYITCYTTGGTGTVWSQGFYTESGGGQNAFPMVNTSATTLDTTATQAITVTAQWGTADVGNTITCSNLIIEALN